MRHLAPLLSILLLAAAPAAATPVRIDFSGVFAAAFDPDELLYDLPFGTPFTGFVEYDTSWPESSDGYYLSPTPTAGRIRITFAGSNTSRVGSVSVNVRNDGPHGDELVISSFFVPSGAFFTPWETLRFDWMAVAFRDPTSTMFSNDFLPGELPQGLAAQVETTGCRWTAPTQFEYCGIFEDTFFATLRIDSYTMVPEPASAMLVAVGISLLARVRSRYGDHTNCSQ